MNTTRKALSVKIDYLAIVFETVTAWEVIGQLLQIPAECFCIREAHIPYKTYTNLYEAGCIQIFSDCERRVENIHGTGAYLVLKGEGCDWLQEHLQEQGKGIVDFFRECISCFGKDNFHLTRLDITIDDRNETSYFTVGQLHQKCRKREFLSKSRSFHFHESEFDEDVAKTLYIGDRKSNIMYRFYEKNKEQAKKSGQLLEEIGNWNRTEIELHDEVAQGFILRLAGGQEGLAQLAFDFLGSNLKFIIPNENQKNKSRWKTCRFWKRFLGDVKELKLHIDYHVTSLYDTQVWLKSGGGLSAFRLFRFLKKHEALGKLEDIEKLMENSTYSGELRTKAVAHLMQINREDLIPLIYAETGKVGQLA